MNTEMAPGPTATGNPIPTPSLAPTPSQTQSQISTQNFNSLEEDSVSNLWQHYVSSFGFLQSQTSERDNQDGPQTFQNLQGMTAKDVNGANACPGAMQATDSYLNFTLNKTWEPKEMTRHALLPLAPTMPRRNYQYNPNSSITRVKGSLSWDGYLPPRIHETGEFSRKVFLGGVPWDVTEIHLQQTFGRYGDFKVEWPSNFNAKRNTTKSFLYLIFSNLSSIPLLLNDCAVEQHGGSVTYTMGLLCDLMSRPVQLIPWFVEDNAVLYKDQDRVNSKLTVFVGALHGRLYAHALAHIFEEVFGNVAYVQIDTDRYKYPIGSGRVTFATFDSYRAAIEENYLTIVAPKFSKRIQIEPYIEDIPCGMCRLVSAPNFCKSRLCFDYFCDNCWGWQHSIKELRSHQPVKRNRKADGRF